MDFLPDEVLDMVFECLSTPMLACVCVHVCRRWQLLIERRALALREQRDECRLQIATRAILVTTFPVNLVGLMDNITENVRYLREITAHAPASFHEPHVMALRQLPHLKHLDVFMFPRLLDERLTDIIRRLDTLVANENLAPRLLRDLAESSQLVALHMFGRAKRYPWPEMMAALRARIPYLRELTLCCKRLPDEAFSTIGDCYNLCSLQLYSCWLMSTDGARAVCRPRGLRRLHVTSADLVLPHALSDMLELLPENLKELVLSDGWFGDQHVQIVARSAPDLRIVELWKCKLTARGAQKLASALPKLEQLDLDLKIPKRYLRSMARHPCLRMVRCVIFINNSPICEVDGLLLLNTDGPYAFEYFHWNRRGFRSSLYYYWTQDVPVNPFLLYHDPDINPKPDLFF